MRHQLGGERIMSDLMTRRRELTPAASEPGEWDSVWEFTDGSPATKGWTQNGTPRSMTNSGLPLRNCYFTKDLAITNGVIEAKCIISNFRTDMNTARALFRIGDSNNAIKVIFRRYTDLRIDLQNHTDSGRWERIGSFEWGGEYVVRITINGNSGSVEVNGITIAEDIDTSKITDKGTLLFGNNATYGESVWQYVKYKNLG